MTEVYPLPYFYVMMCESLPGPHLPDFMGMRARRQVAPPSPSDLMKDATRDDAKQRYLFKVLPQVEKTQC